MRCCKSAGLTDFTESILALEKLRRELKAVGKDGRGSPFLVSGVGVEDAEGMDPEGLDPEGLDPEGLRVEAVAPGDLAPSSPFLAEASRASSAV